MITELELSQEAQDSLSTNGARIPSSESRHEVFVLRKHYHWEETFLGVFASATAAEQFVVLRESSQHDPHVPKFVKTGENVWQSPVFIDEDGAAVVYYQISKEEVKT